MPTQAEFQMAADTLFAAAAQVEQVALTSKSFDAANILRGGSLGLQVPAKITASADLAYVCSARMENVAVICLERVAIIEDYFVRLGAYDLASAAYSSAAQRYYTHLAAWEASDGQSGHPGVPPTAPTPPDPPPAWADVRRVS